jgi:hypothetical protein
MNIRSIGFRSPPDNDSVTISRDFDGIVQVNDFAAAPGVRAGESVPVA